MHDPHPPVPMSAAERARTQAKIVAQRKSENHSDGQTQTRKACAHIYSKGNYYCSLRAGHSQKDFHSSCSRLGWRQFSSSALQLRARGGS
jgi:hypothetical protein